MTQSTHSQNVSNKTAGIDRWPLIDEVIQMLESYIYCIQSDGHVERWHYIPAIQEVIEELTAGKAGAGATPEIDALPRDYA